MFKANLDNKLLVAWSGKIASSDTHEALCFIVGFAQAISEEQIIRILQEAEAGLTVADICRKHNCSTTLAPLHLTCLF